jgi:hypothetical protein
MSLPENPPPQTDPDRVEIPPTRGWKALGWAMETLGTLFLMAGSVSIIFVLSIVPLPAGTWLLTAMLLLGWMLAPIISGALLLYASIRLAGSTRGLSTWLVVAAAAAFVGLAWAAMTAAILLNPIAKG